MRKKIEELLTFNPVAEVYNKAIRQLPGASTYRIKGCLRYFARECKEELLRERAAAVLKLCREKQKEKKIKKTKKKSANSRETANQPDSQEREDEEQPGNSAASETENQPDSQKRENEEQSENPAASSFDVAEFGKVLWIGCADGCDGIDGTQGNMIVYRNIGNLIPRCDIGVHCAIQYAVEQMKVERIIVCGHANCNAIVAAMKNESFGNLQDAWLCQIKDVYTANKSKLDAILCDKEKVNALVQMNIIANVSNVATSRIVQAAWAKGQKLFIHGIYQEAPGHLMHTKVCVCGPEKHDAIYKA